MAASAVAARDYADKSALSGRRKQSQSNPIQHQEPGVDESETMTLAERPIAGRVMTGLPDYVAGLADGQERLYTNVDPALGRAKLELSFKDQRLLRQGSDNPLL